MRRRAMRVVPRFYARYGEPGAEAVDAFAVTSWGESECPTCRGVHREVVLAFPPADLVCSFVRKAEADGVRGIVLVPTAITAGHWPLLLAASIPQGPRQERYRSLGCGTSGDFSGCRTRSGSRSWRCLWWTLGWVARGGLMGWVGAVCRRGVQAPS